MGYYLAVELSFGTLAGDEMEIVLFEGSSVILGSAEVDHIISDVAESEQVRTQSFLQSGSHKVEELKQLNEASPLTPEITGLSKKTTKSDSYDQFVVPSVQMKSVDVNWDSLKQSGLSELKAGGSSTKKVLLHEELLKHVPTETTVMKYGYIEDRVLDILESIIETSGVLSKQTLQSIYIKDMKLSDDGRDINIHYQIKQFSAARISQTSRMSHTAGFRGEEEDWMLDDLVVRNDGYVEKRNYAKRRLSSKELTEQLKQLKQTHRYRSSPLTINDVRIINDINQSTKRIRFLLCKELNIKRVPQLHFIHVF